MKLKSILDKDFIFVNSKVKTKEEAIDLILNEFHQGYKFKRGMDEIKTAIMDREKLGGTFFGDGMSVPHARLEGFNDLLVGIVLPQDPIVEPDGKVIKCFIIFLTTKAGSALYLQTLASFIKMGREPKQYKQLLACKTSSDILHLLDNVYIKKGITVEDIMPETVYSIKAEKTLKDLADYLYKNNISYVPVVNDQQELIGEVNMNDLLKVGVPNYAVMIGNLDFLSHFEPFEELLKNEEKIKVEHIMRKVSLTLKLETTLIETALEMTKNNRRHIPVVEKGKLMGVVSYMNLLSKVIRA